MHGSNTQSSGKVIPNPSASTTVPRTVLGGLFRRRACLVPTWRAVALAIAIVLLTIWGVMRHAHSYLSYNRPLRKGGLVVEGWLSDKALEHAMFKFREDGYEMMYVTGGPVDIGSQLLEYRSYAELCYASLVKLGMDTNRLQAVPAPHVRQDRTYTAALTLKHWLAQHGRTVTHLTVVSESVHARRSRLLFAKAFGTGVEVGSVAVPTDHYDMNRWWASSPGVRAVLSEMIAWVYARFFFWPPAAGAAAPVPVE